MKTITIGSHAEMLEKMKGNDRSFVLLYKSASSLSICALQNIDEALTEVEDVQVLTADVTTIRDIHPHYNVTSVPSLLVFEKGHLTNTIKGCNDAGYYRSLFENVVFMAKTNGDSPQKNVTVYSTPTCTWCNTLKGYLRKNHIRFRDVDVSRDQRMAEELVRKSGQQGVPQTEIDGQIIVGFDKQRINTLLGING
ncbi:MAG TPA: thioredoxin family protein [Bacteroidales bacterium]|nr:thioredoxin family protein [Bacteroidales bacterium]